MYKKGNVPWNKNKKGYLSGEAHWHWGGTITEEHKKKLELSRDKPEVRKKISESKKGSKAWNKGKTLTEEHRRRLSESHKGQKAWNKGKKTTDEQKKKLSLAHIGKLVGEKNPQWKGDDVGYFGLHNWVKRHLGKAKKCEHCGVINAKKYEWANKSRLYLRLLDDWISLCVSCHKKYDSKK